MIFDFTPPIGTLLARANRSHPMVNYGYTLSSEEQVPLEMVANAICGEEPGFEFLSISDHFHAWIPEQPHSPPAW